MSFFRDLFFFHIIDEELLSRESIKSPLGTMTSGDFPFHLSYEVISRSVDVLFRSPICCDHFSLPFSHFFFFFLILSPSFSRCVVAAAPLRDH